MEELLAQWTEEAVLLEAWDTKGDARLRISAIQDEQSKMYFDLDQQPTQMRTNFRTGHDKGTLYSEMALPTLLRTGRISATRPDAF